MLEETKLESADLNSMDSEVITTSEEKKETLEPLAEDLVPSGDNPDTSHSASYTANNLSALLEAIILAAGRPISEEEMLKLFVDIPKPSKKELRLALKELQDSCETRGIALSEIASGYQFHVKLEWSAVVSRLWEEKAPKYSRALFETLALIAYRQPITRGEIEEIRGVSLSLSIFKTLLEEREWIRVVGHKEVPGRPALYATTKNFLDYFGLKSLEELPSLPEIMNLDSVELPEAALEALKGVGIEFRSNSDKEQDTEHNEINEDHETNATILQNKQTIAVSLEAIEDIDEEDLDEVDEDVFDASEDEMSEEDITEADTTEEDSAEEDVDEFLQDETDIHETHPKHEIH